MEELRRSGLGLAAAAVASWVLGGVAYLTTTEPPRLIAGALYSLGVPLSISASVLFLITLRVKRRSSRASQAKSALEPIAALLAVIAAVVQGFVIFLGSTAIDDGTPLLPLFVCGAAAFIAATALMARLPRTTDRP